ARGDGPARLLPAGRPLRGCGLRPSHPQRRVGRPRRILRAGTGDPPRAHERRSRGRPFPPAGRARPDRPRGARTRPRGAHGAAPRARARAAPGAGPGAGRALRVRGSLTVWGLIPAAGLGSRIQPLAFSKEPLPVGSRWDHGVERPRAVSEYLLERMVLGGATKICFVVSHGKSDILEYYGERF